MEASFIPATMKDQKQKPSLGTLLRGLFQLCGGEVAVTGAGTSFLMSSLSSSDESRRLEAPATRLEISFKLLAGVLILSSMLSGGEVSGW